MNLPPKLLTGFKYRIDKLKPGEQALTHFPEIAEYIDVFAAADVDEDPEIIVKFMILVYTPSSPLVKDHPNVGKRKTLAMEYLGILPDEKGHYPGFNNMLTVRGDGMRRRLATFLKIQHSMDWAVMCHAQDHLFSIMEEKMPSDPAEALQKRKLINETRSQIEECLDRITAADSLRSVQDAVQWFSAQRTLPIRIETRMDKINVVAPENAKEGKSMVE